MLRGTAAGALVSVSVPAARGRDRLVLFLIIAPGGGLGQAWGCTGWSWRPGWLVRLVPGVPAAPGLPNFPRDPRHGLFTLFSSTSPSPSPSSQFLLVIELFILVHRVDSQLESSLSLTLF